MVKLVPDWALLNEDFWEAITRRNTLFIKLRYIAVLMLVIFLLSAVYILNLELTDKQIFALSLISLIIFLYNFALVKIRQKVGFCKDQFNKLHLSLLQMVLDLVSLTILIYYTGGVDSPVYLFYIFHMIIGSLILPGRLIYGLCLTVIIVYSTIIILQFNNIIGNYLIKGLFTTCNEHTLSFIIIFILVFSTMMLISVFLANKIANQLYLREWQLTESLKKIEEAEIEKQTYIMGIVHEIKTPVAAVQSLLDLVIGKYLGPISSEVEEKLLRARKRTEDSITMINDILKISRLKLLTKSTAEEVNVSEILQNLSEQFSESADKKNIKISFSENRITDRLFKGDKVVIELAFSNLIANAIKYTEANGKVDISIVEESENCIIKINDTGVGIPKEDLGKVFSQFYRATNIKNKNYEGSGMGLSIVLEIIEKIKGKISIDSPSEIGTQDKPGTLVTVIIPCEKKEEVSTLKKLKMKTHLKI